MDLIVFDLDGTLLDSKSEVSAHTQETLRLLREKNIAYTVATGRTLHAARNLLEGHGFSLPHIYKNGVMTWRPEEDSFSHCALLTSSEVEDVLQAFATAQVSPFIFTLEDATEHTVYHPAELNEAESKLVTMFARDRGLRIADLNDLSSEAKITNISALGEAQAIDSVAEHVAQESHL
ncbi:MAG: HAD family hydrolase, partial [Halioglobus sp.]